MSAGATEPRPGRGARPWHHYLRSALFVVVLGTSFLPRWARRGLARITARFVYVLAPRLRRRIEKNLSRVMVGALPPARLRASTVAVLVNYGDYVLDFLSLLRGDVGRWRGATTGEERLERAGTAGRGVLLATAHVGSWEMAALFLARRTRRVTLVSMPEEIGWLGRLRSRIRNSQSHEEVLLGKDPMAVIELLNRLRAGGFVGVQIDRVAGGGRDRLRGEARRREHPGLPRPYPRVHRRRSSDAKPNAPESRASLPCSVRKRTNSRYGSARSESG
jgi:lauroyl/myristoyl acyltransferase